MANVVSITRPVDDVTDDVTTVVTVDQASTQIQPRVQLRVPLRNPDEALIAINLLEAALLKCRQELARARRNHRHTEALIMCSHHLRQVNGLMNVKRHTAHKQA